jgi:hypothetical protein
VIRDLYSGQYSNPLRVVAFNTAGRWSRDVSEDLAEELGKRLSIDREEAPACLEDFLDRHGGRPSQLALPLRV